MRQKNAFQKDITKGVIKIKKSGLKILSLIITLTMIFPLVPQTAKAEVISTTSVVAWGSNVLGSTTVPEGLTRVTAVAAGMNHSVALKYDGTVVAWGGNMFGQAAVPAGLSNVLAIAAGSYHTLALKVDGTVVGWGNNASGETTAPEGLANVKAIAAGTAFSVALKNDGTVVAWGYNGNGQTSVPAGLSNVTAIAAGGSHTVALKADGTVVAWGNNDFGQATVPAGLTNVKAIAAGNTHTVALKTDGTIVMWGQNLTTTPEGLNNIKAISAGSSCYTVALKNDGTVMAWDNMGVKSVPAGLSNVKAVAAGSQHALAIVSTVQSQPKPSSLIGVPATACGANDGKIVGTKDTMEYKLSTASEYTAAAGSEITGLAPGTYYVRYAANPSFDASEDAVVEVLDAPIGNVAAGKIPTSSVAFTNASAITDGNKSLDSYADSGVNSGVQWIQLDMGKSYNVNNINLWHYYGGSRTYHDVIVQLSNDPAFETDVTTVYNNDTDNSAGRGKGYDFEYIETSEGMSLKFKTVNARYARFYSNGSNVNKFNHYVEIEISNRVQTPEGNLAASKFPTSYPYMNNANRITDGNKSADMYAEYPDSGFVWVQLDLGNYYDVSNIKLWHYYGDGRKYHDVVVQLSNDPTFASGVTTVFNNDTDNSIGRGTGKDNEYVETSAGLNLAFPKVNARYARFYTKGNTLNGKNHYVEIEISNEKVNLAQGKAATTSSVFANQAYATDKSVNTDQYANGAGAGLQWLQVDLGAEQDINEINLWHYFGSARTYKDVIVQISNDPEFKTYTSVFNNDANNSAGFGAGKDAEYSETSAGKSITFSTMKGRYVRFYSNGSNINGYNHYVEVEVCNNHAKGLVPSYSGTLKNGGLTTDGSKSTYSDGAAGLQWIQYNLGAAKDINEINLWHYAGRTYKDVIVQVSNDPEFKTYTSVFNNDANNSAGFGAGKDAEYLETSAGKKITFSTVNAQYVRLYSNGSNVNGYNHYSEVEICNNHAAGKPVTATSPAFSGMNYLNDGDKNVDRYANGLAPGLQWVQIDLGDTKSVSEISLWHYFGGSRQYHDVLVQLSDDPTFKTYTTVYNNDTNNSAGFGAGKDTEYVETSLGKNIKFSAVNARYVRFYSNGSNINGYNHYVEAEVLGN
jgi:hypothetical protein